MNRINEKEKGKEKIKEKDMLKMIAESAQKIEAPEELYPKQIEMKLNAQRQRKRNWRKAIATAACFCVCFGVVRYVLDHVSYSDGGQEAYMQASNESEKENSQEKALREELLDQEGAAAADAAGADNANAVNVAGADNASADNATGAGNAAVQEKEAEAPLKKIGKMYTLAENYGDVYDVLKKTANRKMYFEAASDEAYFGAARSEMKEAMEVEDAADGAASMGNSMESMSGQKDIVNDVSAGKDYSNTNLQVEGVDESDIVKTDGRYLYIVQEDRVQVLDVQDKKLKEAGVIMPGLQSDTDEIREMYVSDNMLTLIIQAEETSVNQHAIQGNELDDEQKQKKLESSMADEIYGMDTEFSVKVQTYDITDPEKAVLKDTATQDGWYQTSRKIGSRLYLFTNLTLHLPEGLARESAATDEAASDWIPSVNGQALKADCIYLPRSGNDGLLAASIDLENHSQIVDTKLMVHEYAQLYVTQNSIYLYYTDYGKDVEKTKIARFALDADGTIHAKAAAALKGAIQDTFAIHEREGYLQALTSVTGTTPWENRVYVLDENMQITGKLTGLAIGEQIYSARFAGATGYFVTYRNTDPLFSVDFSDPKNPKVIGELKVTGFSEYLHFWSDDLLLGIGYETDPENGERIGVKLSMFDLSDPADVKEKGRIVLEDADYCDGMYDYKAVLVSREKNMIALTTETYNPAYQKDYRVFSYEDGKFTASMQRVLARNGHYDENKWRSVYVGDVLYLVGQDRTVAFGMRNGWKKIGRVTYGR